MGITNLPKPGIGFKATLGPGSFKRKLSNATRYGDLKNLRDNQKALVDIAKKYEKVIRIKGGLTRLQKRDAWLGLKKKTPKLTYADKYEAKKIFEHLGRGGSAGVKKTAASGKLVQASDKKSYLTEKQIKRNLKVNMQRDESGLGLDRKRYKASFSDNVVSTKSIGVAAAVAEAQKDIGAGRIGINTGPVGFIGGQPDKGQKDKAVNFKVNNKLPDNSLPKIPPGGVRPLGL